MAGSLGVVVATCRRDVHFARAACASIRHFLGELPICLLVDGRVSVRDIVSTYGVSVMRVADIQDPGLRAISTGFGFPKLAALWEAPFERFLYLDADTIVWGDVTTLRDPAADDFVVDEPIPHFRFDSWGELWHRAVPGIDEAFPDFDWARYAPRFANTGAWFARRGAVDLDPALELVRLQRQRPPVRILGLDSEQGILNFLLFRASARGEIRLRQAPLQDPARLPDSGFATRFEFASGRPVVGEPRVLHWVGVRKPTMRWPHETGAPSAFFRKEYRRARRDKGLRSLVPGGLLLRYEDLQRLALLNGRALGGRIFRSVEFRRRAGLRAALRWPSSLRPRRGTRR